MTKGIYTKRKGIGFSSTVIIYLSLIVFYGVFHPASPSSPLTLNTMIMLGVYMLIGLASVDYKPISMMIERVWNMNCQDGVSDNSKFQTIKSYIAMNVNQWNKYNTLYANIVEGNTKAVWSTKDSIKEHLLRIPKGQLNIKQFIWIVVYVGYNVIKGNGYLPFLTPDYSDIDFLIDFVGVGFFSFTSGTIIGLGSYMEKLFESIKPDKLIKVEESLRLIEQNIIFGARHFGFLRDVVEVECEKCVDEIVPVASTKKATAKT
ncbi:hypothetical protein LCGC14_0223860 [marine sediment metagenome]|uniref:Uncharacterized protein n=1 Tax=marine sediment metagenome TaxID=412755 RepID=A0A0F9XFZ1_9ZZZZ